MRLIDADELNEWIENWFAKNTYYHPYSNTNNIPTPELYDILERMPTIEAKPVRHGHWIEIYKTDKGKMVHCNACRCRMVYWIGTDRVGNYCPNCGAKMD